MHAALLPPAAPAAAHEWCRLACVQDVECVKRARACFERFRTLFRDSDRESEDGLQLQSVSQVLLALLPSPRGPTGAASDAAVAEVSLSRTCTRQRSCCAPDPPRTCSLLSCALCRSRPPPSVRAQARQAMLGGIVHGVSQLQARGRLHPSALDVIAAFFGPKDSLR
jgi:hypothetical protein